MTTITLNGFVDQPTGPNSPSYGYDNGGFFGSTYANLGGNPFTLTWIGADCNCYGGPGPGPIDNAILTINGVSLDLALYNNIWSSEWLDNAAGNTVIQVETQYLVQTTPPWYIIYPTSRYILNTTFTDFHGAPSGIGVAYLLDSEHIFETDLRFTIGVGPIGVPAPVAGEGLAPVIILCILVGFVLTTLAKRVQCPIWSRRSGHTTYPNGGQHA